MLGQPSSLPGFEVPLHRALTEPILIAEAIDLIVFIKGRGSERRVESILELAGLDEEGSYVLKPASAPALHVV